MSDLIIQFKSTLVRDGKITAAAYHLEITDPEDASKSIAIRGKTYPVDKQCPEMGHVENMQKAVRQLQSVVLRAYFQSNPSDLEPGSDDIRLSPKE